MSIKWFHTGLWESCSVVSGSLWPRGLYSPWNSSGHNTGVGSLSLLLGIFPTQGSNPGLPHCRRILYQVSHQGSPRILEWVVYPFSSRSSRPRNGTKVSCIAGDFFAIWATRRHLDQCLAPSKHSVSVSSSYVSRASSQWDYLGHTAAAGWSWGLLAGAEAYENRKMLLIMGWLHGIHWSWSPCSAGMKSYHSSQVPSLLEAVLIQRGDWCMV